MRERPSRVTSSSTPSKTSNSEVSLTPKFM
jgi:hypothetical protein